MSDILAEANKAQTRDEVIEALRAQVRALTLEMEEWQDTACELALEVIATSNGEMSQDALLGHAREILEDEHPAMAETATTAPETGQGA